MIYETLNAIAVDANKYFAQMLDTNEKKVVLSSILNTDGSVAVSGQNKIVFTLVNVTPNENLKNLPPDLKDRRIPISTPHYKLSLLVSAYFDAGNYAESLQFLSMIMSYFSDKAVFNQINTPGMDSVIAEIRTNLMAMTQEQMITLWRGIGSPLMPSVLYEIEPVLAG